MSDSQLSQGQPVYPPADRPATPAPETTEATQDSAGVQDESPRAVEINGQSYTEDQLREALEGNMRQSDYTRKTQELAEHRRQMEAEREALEAQRAQLEAQMERIQGRQTEDTWDDPQENRVLNELSQKVNQLNEAFRRREERDQETLQRFEQEEALEAALDSEQRTPFFNRDEVKEYMKIMGLNANQVRVAVNALYGARIGERLGHMKAVEHGASTPPVMGSGHSTVSPGFTHPSEVPGAQADISQLDMRKDLVRMALEDPEIPNAG